MNLQPVKRLIEVVAIFVGLVTGLYGLWTFPPVLKLVSVFLLAAVIICVWWLETRCRGWRRELRLHNDLISVEQVRTEADLMQIWRADVDEWGEDGIVPFAKLKEWFLDYNRGLFMLKVNGILYGYWGIWSVSQESWDELISGQSNEAKLDIKEFRLIANDRKSMNVLKEHPKFYIGGIRVFDKCPYWEIARVFLVVKAFQHWMETEEKVFRQWMTNQKQHSMEFVPCISAIAFSPEGEETLNGRYGFNKVSQTDELQPHPVYICSLTKEDADIRLRRDRKLLAWLIKREKSKRKTGLQNRALPLE